MRRGVALFLILATALSSSACADLSAIRKFTESAAEVGKRFPALAKDFNASCRRRITYREVGQSLLDPIRLAAVAHPQKGSPEEQQLAEACKEFGPEDEKRLIEANGILFSYLKVMGELAADDLISFDKDFDALGDSFTGGNIFNAPEVNAVKGLAKFLSKAFAEGYRRKQLKATLEEQNANVQTAAAQLSKIVARDYVEQLELERDQMRSSYKLSIAQYKEYMGRVAAHTAASGGAEFQDPLPIIMVKGQWDNEENAIDQKIAAAQAYAKALDGVAKGHQKLYDSRNDLNSKAVLRTVLSYGSAINTSFEDFRKAF
ncbi:MAG: hypothetical protein ACJ754_12390 [Pyrinomonadaceae bacterium]